MLVNQSLTTATLALFRPQSNNATAQSAAKISTASMRMAKTADMSGFYTAPIVSTASNPVLSEQTQKVMGTIKSLIANEGAAINRGTKAIWSSQLGRDIAPETRYTDLSVEDRMSMDREARKSNSLNERFRHRSYVAAMDKSVVKSMGYIGQKLDVTQDELIENTINRLVDIQVRAMKDTFEMSADPEVMALMGEMETTNTVPEWTAALEQTVRADLTAKRWGEFERGEIDMTVTIYSSKHAANYGEAYKVLDMRTGEMTVNEANRVDFDEAWELSDTKKQHYARWLESDLAKQMTAGWGEHRAAITRDVYA